jgi:nucleoside-diphosphate-sugar epimerase
MNSLFITGASGFIGSHLLDAIPSDYSGAVVCLTRRPELLAPRLTAHPAWRAVQGSLENADTYRDYLAQVDTVLHLASVTGKAHRREYHDTIVEGTRSLLTECARQGVARFGFVSSIAAKFRDQRHYPYAEAKRHAEDLVRASRLAHVIFRPTMVFGLGSSVFEGLRKLATAPVMIVFGDGRVRVQPVDVSDVAACLWGVLAGEEPTGETLEIGGGQVLTIEELLRSIRVKARGRSGPAVHLPLWPLRATLAALEPFALSLLPVTAGQLASFANDGVADRNPLVTHYRPQPKDVPAMLGQLLDHG